MEKQIVNKCNQMIDVSVIIPVYNTEKYLRRCLQSIQNQTISSIEVICIDDGSIDNSGKIIDDFCMHDKRFKKLETKNLGAGAARNHGLNSAVGKYIVFLDSDDWFDTEMLEKAFRKAEENELEICIWGAVEYDNVVGTLNYTNPHLRLDLLPEQDIFSGIECQYVFNMTSGASWNKLYLFSFLKEHNLSFMELSSYNDLYFTYTALLSASRISVLKKSYTFYRINNKESVQGKRKETIDNVFIAIAAVSDYIADNTLYPENIIRSFKNYLLSSLYFIIYREESSEVREKVMKYVNLNSVILNMLETDVFSFNMNVWQRMNEMISQYCLKEEKIKLESGEKREVKISIVVPAFNDESTIRKCLESLLVQKLEGLEFIVVDDCSTDSTYSVMMEYALEDSRFKIFHHNQNLSAFHARKDGVLAAQGQYVMFVDADDYLMDNACECLWKLLDDTPVDILHFGTKIITDIHDEKRVCDYKKLINPRNEVLSGDEIFDAFVTRNFEGHLWNKIFSRDLAVYALNKCGNDVLPKGQDKYFYWVMAYYAKSYKGCPEYEFYNYCYGLGLEGKDNYVELTDFDIFCKQAWTERAIEAFMRDNSQIDLYEEVLAKSRQNLLRHTIRQWKRLKKEDRRRGLELILEYWNKMGDASEIVAALCDFYKDSQEELIEYIDGIQRNSKEEIKTIGTYYHVYNNGGIQRVLAQLMRIWIAAGYDVVFFTDYPEIEEDYELPTGVTRVTIALNGNSGAVHYSERGNSFEYFLHKYNVDVMIYHDYLGNSLFWDMLLSKFMDIPFVLYYHNVFTKFMITYEDKFFKIPQSAKLADAVICLSDMDKIFWDAYNNNTIVMKNPLVFDLCNIEKNSLSSNIIVWVGRLDEIHKRFMEPINVMKILLKKVPDAKLMIVGRDSSGRNYDRLKARIEKLHLENSIILCGFQKDVFDFYKIASVYIMTSTHEGYPMTLLEALSFGLPTVMYDLPYLTLTKENRGIISITQGDTEAMADAVADLLTNEDKRRWMGVEARNYIENTYKDRDLADDWKRVFKSLACVHKRDVSDQSMLIWTLVEHYKIFYNAHKNVKEENIQILNKSSSELKEEIEYYQYLLNETRNSFTYKIGRVITFIPRGIRHLLFKKPM
ncbi:MAG: glycosyltransferase [Lachnospiraceae bacterium]|nr:glycosyltransferase [Lachnospiraceae bacterium]